MGIFFKKIKNIKHTCLCCGYKTLDKIGDYDICPICFWEDDPNQRDNSSDPDGPNWISLIEAQKNYQKYGACCEKNLLHVRKPKSTEKRDPSWKPFE